MSTESSRSSRCWRQNQKLHLAKINPIMKKYIFIVNALELLEQLLTGKRIEGVLYLDPETRSLSFKAYNRNKDKRPKDVMLCKTPYGWVKRSMKRVKRFTSLPIDMFNFEKLQALDHENRLAKIAMTECD